MQQFFALVGTDMKNQEQWSRCISYRKLCQALDKGQGFILDYQCGFLWLESVNQYQRQNAYGCRRSMCIKTDALIYSLTIVKASQARQVCIYVIGSKLKQLMGYGISIRQWTASCVMYMLKSPAICLFVPVNARRR